VSFLLHLIAIEHGLIMQSTKTKGIALNWFVFIQMHVIINGEINIHYNLNKKGNGNKRKTKKKLNK